MDYPKLVLALWSALITAAAPGTLQTAGQEANEKVQRHFEVASVKPNKSGDAGGSLRRQPGGRVDAVNMPLRTLILFAYQVQSSTLVGGPSWTATDRFDIVAKLEGNPPPVMPGSGPDPLAQAMRALLTDRFKLELHREVREIELYSLTMVRSDARPGAALKASTQDCSPQAVEARRSQPPAINDSLPVCGMQMTAGRLRVGGLPLTQFVNVLTNLVGRVVVDRTGLMGTWDFEMTFETPPGGPRSPGTDLPANSDQPSVFTAVREQLGLKLEPTKGPVEVLVIDRVEPPNPD